MIKFITTYEIVFLNIGMILFCPEIAYPPGYSYHCSVQEIFLQSATYSILSRLPKGGNPC